MRSEAILPILQQLTINKLYANFLQIFMFMLGGPFPLFHSCLQGRAKKFLLSSVTHVPSGLMGCALAA